MLSKNRKVLSKCPFCVRLLMVSKVSCRELFVHPPQTRAGGAHSCVNPQTWAGGAHMCPHTGMGRRRCQKSASYCAAMT